MSRLHEEARDVDRLLIHLDVAVPHELARRLAAARESHAVHDVVETRLQRGEEIVSRDSRERCDPLEGVPELSLADAVDALDFLLLAELLRVLRQLATARRRKLSEYSKQLREKQKIKRIYGVSERQFRNTFERVAPLPGITGHNLLAALESRLDNVVYRMGFAGSRKAARQLVRHRHVEVNQKSVDIPSFLVQPGHEIRVRMKSREQASVMAAMDQSSRGAPLSWIAVDRETFSGKMLERPTRANIPIAAQEQLVVELYSK